MARTSIADSSRVYYADTTSITTTIDNYQSNYDPLTYYFDELEKHRIQDQHQERSRSGE